jgi:hypothetical protein
MSEVLPGWLPELIDTNGSWDEIRSRLYAVFERDFRQGKPKFKGLPVWWDRRFKDDDPHEEGFWHLVTRDDKQRGERLLETPRAKRLAWCRATIDHCREAEVLVFDYVEGDGQVRTYLWVKVADYVVILGKALRKKKTVAYMLVTAFSLDGPSRRRAMQQKYDNRVQENAIAAPKDGE